MKKIIAMVALVFSCMLAYAQTNGEVIVMNKAMFIKDVFDYEKSQDWKQACHHRLICRLVRTLPHGGSHYEGTGQRVCR